jgi:transcriptional regulator with XRE-family HTH domain
MSDFSVIIKQLRIKHNVKQTDIANHLGVLPRTIRFYESGQRRPDFDGLIALADFFNVSLDYLVGRSDEETFAISPEYKIKLSAEASRDNKK